MVQPSSTIRRPYLDLQSPQIEEIAGVAAARLGALSDTLDLSFPNSAPALGLRLGAPSHASRVSPDWSILFDCYAELQGRGAMRRCHAVERMFEDLGYVPPQWASVVRNYLGALRPERSGGHHLYVALTSGWGAGGELGLYVGETRYKPARRFRSHLAGVFSGGCVQTRGLALLFSLFAHLNPLDRAEAKKAEFMIAEQLRSVFRALGLPAGRVQGPHQFDAVAA